MSLHMVARVFWIALTLGWCWLVGLLTHHETVGQWLPARTPARFHLAAIGDGAWSTTVFFTQHPWLAGLFVALVVLPVAVSFLAGLIRREVAKDPQRMFTPDQRRAGFERAGGRCEMEIIPFVRCRRTAEHGDHWFPWSLGGATDMANFVGGCARCNTSKGAKVPTYWQTQRLAARRRRYFDHAIDTHPGSRIAA